MIETIAIEKNNLHLEMENGFLEVLESNFTFFQMPGEGLLDDCAASEPTKFGKASEPFNPVDLDRGSNDYNLATVSLEMVDL